MKTNRKLNGENVLHHLSITYSRPLEHLDLDHAMLFEEGVARVIFTVTYMIPKGRQAVVTFYLSHYIVKGAVF